MCNMIDHACIDIKKNKGAMALIVPEGYDNFAN